MYRAKGRAQQLPSTTEPALGPAQPGRMRLENALRGAVQQGELSLVQPQFRIASGDTLVGMEALVRWNTPNWAKSRPGASSRWPREIGLIGEIGAGAAPGLP